MRSVKVQRPPWLLVARELPHQLCQERLLSDLAAGEVFQPLQLQEAAIGSVEYPSCAVAQVMVSPSISSMRLEAGDLLAQPLAPAADVVGRGSAGRQRQRELGFLPAESHWGLLRAVFCGVVPLRRRAVELDARVPRIATRATATAQRRHAHVGLSGGRNRAHQAPRLELRQELRGGSAAAVAVDQRRDCQRGAWAWMVGLEHALATQVKFALEAGEAVALASTGVGGHAQGPVAVPPAAMVEHQRVR